MRNNQWVKRLSAAAVAASLLTIPAMALEFPDTQGHWGQGAIERWSDYGVLEGANGLFNPDNNMTRAELAAVISRLLGLQEVAENTFSDVDENAWYAEDILKCAAAGIIQGTGAGANPNSTVTRQEASVMLARALGIQPAEGDITFADGSQVADWAAGYIKAMTDKSIINGLGDNQFAPLNDINRASVVTILNNAITSYANEAGASVQAGATGITLIAAPDVTVTGTAEDLLVAPGAAESDVMVESANVSGTIIVTAQAATVTLSENTYAAVVDVAESASASKVVVEQNASVGTVTTAAPSSTITVSGAADKVETTATAAEAEITVSRDAAVTEIAAAGEKTAVSVSGTVESVTISETAADTTVTANSGSTIASVDNSADGTTVSGSGKVESMTTSGSAV